MSVLNINAAMCRVCLNDGNYDINNVSISVDNNTVMLKTALEVFSKQDIDKVENYPENLCDSCTEDLSNAYKFYLKVLYSEQLLIDHFYGRNKVPNAEMNIENKYMQMVEGNTDDLVEEDYIIEECDDYNNPNTINEKLDNSESQDAEHEEEASKSDENEEVELHEIDDEEDIAYNKKPYNKSSTNRIPNMCLTNNVVSILSKSDLPTTTTIINKNPNKRKYCNSNETPNSFSNETLSSLKKLKCLKPDNYIIVPTFVISEKKHVESKSDDFLQKNLLTQDEDDDTHLDMDNENNLPKNVKTLEVAAFKLDQSNHDFNSLLPSNKIHDDETFQCNYCQKAFGTSYHLVLHTRKSHVCQFCLEAFQKVADLHRHVKQDHNKFECSFCGRIFSNNSNLRCHMRKVHEITLPAHVSLITLSKNDDQESIN